MNKTQIRNALEVKKLNRINAIKEAENDAQEKLLKKEIDENFGNLLFEINNFINGIRKKEELIVLIQKLKDAIDENECMQFQNWYGIQTFVSLIEYGFSDQICFNWKNEKSKKVRKEREYLISEVEAEYKKLDKMLVNMTANEFYQFLLENGINLEVKETVKPQLPSIKINTKLL